MRLRRVKCLVRLSEFKATDTGQGYVRASDTDEVFVNLRDAHAAALALCRARRGHLFLVTQPGGPTWGYQTSKRLCARDAETWEYRWEGEYVPRVRMEGG